MKASGGHGLLPGIRSLLERAQAVRRGLEAEEGDPEQALSAQWIGKAEESLREAEACARLAEEALAPREARDRSPE